MMQPSSQPLTPADRLIPWYFVAFFVVLTLLLSFFAWIAVHSFTGVITENAYQEGLKYNEIIQQAEKQQTLGWKADTQVTTSSSGTVRVAIFLQDKAGNIVPGAKGKLTFQRPTQAGFDKKVALTEISPGHYTAETSLPLKGIWDIYAAFVKEGNPFQIKKTYITP